MAKKGEGHGSMRGMGPCPILLPRRSSKNLPPPQRKTGLRTVSTPSTVLPAIIISLADAPKTRFYIILLCFATKVEDHLSSSGLAVEKAFLPITIHHFVVAADTQPKYTYILKHNQGCPPLPPPLQVEKCVLIFNAKKMC